MDKNVSLVLYKKRKDFYIVAAIVLLILVFLVGIQLFFKYVGKKLNIIEYTIVDESNIGLRESIDKNLKDFENILLVGTDLEVGDSSQYRTADYILLISINKEKKLNNLIMLDKDLYVTIHAEEGQERLDILSNAYRYGGIENLLNAVNSNLDLNVKKYFEFDLKNIREIFDMLGGLNVEIGDDELLVINNFIKDTESSFINLSGNYLLNGDQLLAYMKTNSYIKEGIKKINKPTFITECMIEKYDKEDFDFKNNIMNIFLRNSKTNLSKFEVLKLFLNRHKFSMEKVIIFPYYELDLFEDGRILSLPKTLEKNVIKLHKDIFYERYYGVSTPVKNVSEFLYQNFIDYLK
ncbi:MAG: LCP family protein [Clostridia bacterium]|nr:LCP family protein [Bacilli bacterium]MBR3511533.1 LCP family protein [Clostridia bacterium]